MSIRASLRSGGVKYPPIALYSSQRLREKYFAPNNAAAPAGIALRHVARRLGRFRRLPGLGSQVMRFADPLGDIPDEAVRAVRSRQVTKSKLIDFAARDTSRRQSPSSVS